MKDHIDRLWALMDPLDLGGIVAEVQSIDLSDELQEEVAWIVEEYRNRPENISGITERVGYLIWRLGSPQLSHDEHAEKHYTGLLQSEETRVEGYYRLAAHELGRQNPDAAIENCRLALAISPDQPWSFYYMALAGKMKGDLELSKVYAQRALNIEPDHPLNDARIRKQLQQILDEGDD